ncbi:MAG: hypothetical protein J6A07_04340 [Firmicutes bacterium]|nr:hypothetical protein [Bacillota bacterium]
MKNYYNILKCMFSTFVVMSLLFTVSYIHGIICFDNIYDLLDETLPFVPFIIASIIGFGIVSAKSTALAEAGETAKVNRIGKVQKIQKIQPVQKTKKIDYERRYIIKTYSRDGIQKKHVFVRRGYNMPKSA